jgi:hypothetical protein
VVERVQKLLRNGVGRGVGNVMADSRPAQ